MSLIAIPETVHTCAIGEYGVVIMHVHAYGGLNYDVNIVRCFVQLIVNFNYN